jgi:hypothetical protein
MPKPKLKTSEASKARENYGYTEAVYSISSSNASNPSSSPSSSGNYSTAAALKIDYDDTGESSIDDVPDIQNTQDEIAGYRLLPVASKSENLNVPGGYVDNGGSDDDKPAPTAAQPVSPAKSGELKFSSGTNGTQ